MRVRFAPPTLEGLDRESGGTLVLWSFHDDRPLRGLAGRVDWRLCGRLSALLAHGDIDAAPGTSLLCPVADRLPFQRLLYVGLGARGEHTPQRFAEACHFVSWKLARMAEYDFALALPGQMGRGLGPREAVWAWREGLIRSFDSSGLRALDICILAPRADARELRGPMLAVANEVNEALQREQASRAIANAPPMPRTTSTQHVSTRLPAAGAPEAKRPKQTGVIKIG